MLHTIAFTLAISFAGAAAGQAARPDPADPKAPAPAQRYESAFRDYRPYADAEAAGWRTANDEMHRLGGHLGHIPQPRAGQPKPAAKPAAHGAHK